MLRQLLLLIIFLNLTPSFAIVPYLSISYPTERMVFQRNANDQASISFAGQYTNPNSSTYTTQYRTQALDLTTGNPTGPPSSWTNVNFNNSIGSFRSFIGSTNLLKGWYRLEIRVLNSNGTQLELVTRKFGVGDVFVIAGQSNSQGYQGEELNPDSDDKAIISYYQNGATDTSLPDAINICTLSITNEDFNFVPTRRDSIKQSLVNFEKIKRNNNRIYPNGVDSWCYAELGKDIVTTTQCPVAFFNAGASGSEIENWTESIPQNPVTQGLTHFRFAIRDNNGTREGCIYNPIDPNYCPTDFFGKFPTTPYTPLRNTLQTFCSIMGIRAILWHQGETDSERKQGSNFDYYEANFNILKERVKTDFRDENNNPQNNLSWFISKVSWWRSYPDDDSKLIPIWSDQTNTNLIGKQTILGNNNRIGADTDNIRMQSNPTNPSDNTRARGSYNVHFSNYGLRMLADRWMSAQPWTGNPIIGKPLLPITITASVANPGTNNYNLSAPAGYAEYIWVISGGLFSNYLYKGRNLNDVKLYSSQTVMCYVSKSSDPNEQNFFLANQYVGRESSAIYPDFLTFYSTYGDFLSTPSPIDQKAYNYINATNAVKNNGTKVNYQAEKAIILENGFTAEAGTTFKAEIISIPDAPQTWSSTNIGSGSGSSSVSSGTLSISGNGSLGGTSDNIHYYNTAFSSANVTITARIDGMSSTDGHRAGIMIRNTNNSNAGFYEFIIDGNGNVGKLKRKNVGDIADLYGYAQCPLSGSWIKIEKTGNTIRCYFKPTDNYPNWLEVIGWDDQSDNNFNPTFQIGFVAYNGASAIFSNISVNGTSVN